MLLSLIPGGIGYAEGARAARTLGGWRTICWALILSAPILVVPVGWLAIHAPAPSSQTLLAFAWVSFGSMFLGFFAWYHGLAIGGIARVGQVQLLQPFLTVLASAMFFGERVGAETFLFALAVIGVIAGGRRALATAAAGQMHPGRRTYSSPS